jgi:hypothetical protein
MEQEIKGSFHIVGNKIIFQRAEYIEDGWFVEMTDDNIVLYEIPLYGGEPIKIGAYYDIISAIKDGNNLT